jgi:hypothetical protein
MSDSGSSQHLAPCVAIVGPANSGKSTLLHGLDDALQHHPSGLLSYVVKGSPDGSGRYQGRSPGLRQSLKAQVKGRWIEETPEQIRRWTRNARRHLDVALLDFGGRHDPANESMLRECSHYVVLARQFQDQSEEAREGMESWAAVSERCGLAPVALIRALWETGEPRVTSAGAVLAAEFRGDISPRGSQGTQAANGEVIRVLAQRIAGLATAARRVPYLDLRLGRDWTLEDLADVGGIGPRIVKEVRADAALCLGGRAPVWAYSAAMHRALDERPGAVVEVFDPKTDDGRLLVPAQIVAPGNGIAAGLDVSWEEGAGLTFLCLQPSREDRLMDVEALASDPRFPVPPAAPAGAGRPLVVSGAVPIWVHLAYARWLRQAWPGRQLGHWDANSQGAFLVTGPGEVRFVACPPPGGSPVAPEGGHA